MRFIELFAGIGGFRYGLEACNRQQQENTEVSGCRDSISNQVKQSSQSEKWGNYTCDRTDDDMELRGFRQEEENAKNHSTEPVIQPNIRQYPYCCVWANEWDKYASAIYRYHYGNIYEGDIRTVDPTTIPEHELIVGGFPCQSFSIAGKRGGLSDTRGTLFAEICRIAGAKKTPYLLLENVKGLLSAPYTENIEEWEWEDFNEDGSPTGKALKKHKAIAGTKGWVFLTILYTLWELGYDCQWQVLNSELHGVPQHRERVFIVGHLRDRCRPQVFPIGEISKENNKLQGFTIGSITARRGNAQSDGDYIVESYGETQEPIIVQAIDANYGKGNAGFAGSKRATVMIHSAYPDLREYKDTSPTISTPSGGGHLPYVAQSLQTDGQLRQGVSWGTDKPQSARNIRRLTPIECERLQGFPDNWTKYGRVKDGKVVEISDTQRYKTCGNAVTTNVITAIGKQLMEVINTSNGLNAA